LDESRTNLVQTRLNTPLQRPDDWNDALEGSRIGEDR
jgi:hypothetical protein